MNGERDVYRLSFTIGPVQGFVAQARRTRDLWTGSWLLSFLAENALVATELAGGTSVIPHRSKADVRSITATRSAVGGIPNRFEVSFEGCDQAKHAGRAAIDAFESAWQFVAKRIHDAYLNGSAAVKTGNGTEAIWNRQVNNFWELSWVVTLSRDPNQLAGLELNQRKQFRNVKTSDEPGTKCSMVTDLQELSGFYGHGNWSQQSKFWEAFGKELNQLDLKANEKLSAIGLIKRLFSDQLKGFDTDFAEHTGWPVAPVPQGAEQLSVQSRWPSLGFVAALPWLRHVKGSPAAREIAGELAQIASASPGEQRRQGYWNSESIPSEAFGLGKWAKIDAPVWFTSGLACNAPEFPPDSLARLKAVQSRLYQTAGLKPVPYYALVLADGDSMGELLGKMQQPTELSQRLNQFSSGVSEVICPQKGNGRVVYAGGDDVFALVTAESALEVAIALRDAYAAAFNGSGAEAQATLSVAIVFAHWRFPLKRTIRTAHELLDDVAKDETGRDALALAVLQGGGLNAVWSAPWDVVRGKQPGSVALDQLIQRFSSDVQEDEAESRPNQERLPNDPFNSSFLYMLRRQFAALMPNSSEMPGKYLSIENVVDSVPTVGELNLLTELAHSEFRRRLSKKQRETIPVTESIQPINDLMTLSYPWRRNEHKAVRHETKEFSFDGWKIARFMKQVHDGRLPEHE